MSLEEDIRKLKEYIQKAENNKGIIGQIFLIYPTITFLMSFFIVTEERWTYLMGEWTKGQKS